MNPRRNLCTRPSVSYLLGFRIRTRSCFTVPPSGRHKGMPAFNCPRTCIGERRRWNRRAPIVDKVTVRSTISLFSVRRKGVWGWKSLAARWQNDDTPPGDLASTLRPQSVLLDQQMLQAPDVWILRCQFNRFSKRHHSIYGLFRFVKGAVTFRRLVFKIESLLKERFHLADRIAAKHGCLETFFLQIFQRP